MPYVPIKIVEVNGFGLTESTDLTVPMTSFIGKTAVLVLENDLSFYTVDLAKIMMREVNIDFTLSVTNALAGKLTDIFVTRNQRSDIPVKNTFGYYDKNIRVLNPISYKDYTVQYTSINTPEQVDVSSRKGFLDDLVISSDHNLSNSLVAVNGVFHRTTMFQNKLYVLDGFRTLRISENEDVTLVDTSNLGGHSIIPLTSSNTSLSVYNGDALINAGVSLKNKTVFVVIDGYFYHLDNNVVYFANDSHVRLRTHRLVLTSQFRHNPRTMRIPDRYGEGSTQSSRKYVDTYGTTFLNKRTVPTSTFTTREFQLSRLRHYHSFLVVVNNPSVFSISTDMIPTGTPQFYNDMSGKPISGMLNYGSGLCPSYVIKNDPFGRKSIFVTPQDSDLDYQNQVRNPLFIPSLINEGNLETNPMCRLVDYVSA